MTSGTAMLAGLLCMGTIACAGKGTGAGVPAIPGGGSPTTMGALPPRVVEGATTYAGVRELRLRADAAGSVTKWAVYHGDETRVPAAVRAVAAKELPDAKVLYYELELYSDLGWVHEVEVEKADGKHCEVSAREDGTLVYVECQMAEAEIPPAVIAAVKSLLPDAEIVEAESKKGPGLDVVHVEAKAGGRLHYLRYSATGERLGHWLRVPALVELTVP